MSSQKRATDRGSSSTCRKRRVLLIEDNASIRKALAHLLCLHDYNVHAVGTVQDALAGLEHNPHHAIVDLMLPDGNGMSVIQAIRLQRLPIQIIVTTGVAVEDLDFHDLKPEVVIQKPYRVERIIQEMKKGCK